MKFEYLHRITVEAELDVDDIGQCCIRGRNDLGEEFYLIIRTDLGFTEQITYGLVVPDLEILPFNVSMQYSRYEYSQSKIERQIDKFLNDPKKLITQADVIEYEEIVDPIKTSLCKIFMFDNETYGS